MLLPPIDIPILNNSTLWFESYRSLRPFCNVAFTNAVASPASGVYLTTRSFPTINGKKVPILPVEEYA